jgi:hypothetical protein
MECTASTVSWSGDENETHSNKAVETLSIRTAVQLSLAAVRDGGSSTTGAKPGFESMGVSLTERFKEDVDH